MGKMDGIKSPRVGTAEFCVLSHQGGNLTSTRDCDLPLGEISYKENSMTNGDGCWDPREWEFRWKTPSGVTE